MNIMLLQAAYGSKVMAPLLLVAGCPLAILPCCLNYDFSVIDLIIVKMGGCLNYDFNVIRLITMKCSNRKIIPFIQIILKS